VAESFFSSLKKEQVKQKIYATRAEAKSEIFEYIEVFYNRKRRHSYLNQMSPMAFEKLPGVSVEKKPIYFLTSLPNAMSEVV
jgi:putative transposase